MSRNKMLSLGASVLAVQIIGCGMPMAPAYFDPRVPERGERTDAMELPNQTLPPLPTGREDPLGGPGNQLIGTTRPSYAGPTTGPSLGYDGEPVLRLTLQQCIQRAVLYNYAVKVAGYEPAIDASRVTEAEALFDPVFFSNLQFQHKDDPTAGEIFTDPSGNGLTSTTAFDRQDIYDAQIGVKQNLPSGAQVQLNWDSSYNYLIPQRFSENPFYENKLNFQVTQPLLRNFGADVNEARIYINRDNARVSLLEYRKALEDNLSKVEEAYWTLFEAESNVATEESVLAENESAYKLQSDRVNRGLLSSLEISQVQSSLEARRATLLRAKADARNLSDQLKQLMNDPNLPVSSPVLIVPGDDPVTNPMNFNIDDQIESGMANRFELGEQLEKIDVASVTYGVARNNTLPKLDFVSTVTPLMIGQPTGPNNAPSDYLQSLSQESKFGHFEYSLGLQIEIPIGNREALSILRRTELQRIQAITEFSDIVSKVSLDIRQAAREVDTTHRLIAVNQQAREAAELALADARERQEKQTEALTPEFVQVRLSLADQVAQHRESENQAVANYNIALERLEKAKGTLLKYNNVIMQEEPYKNEGLLR
jgi:outer membrane protein TolC